MASSVPASSEVVVTHIISESAAGGDRSASARIGAQYPSKAVQMLTVPAAFFAANWAAMLLIITVIGTIPALIAATRTTTDLRAHADSAFRETLRCGVSLLRRDWLMSLALLVIVSLGVVNSVVLVEWAAGGTRVLLAGLALPPTWLAVAYTSAYVATAAELDVRAPRDTVAGAALALVMRRPLRALVAPAAIIAVSPLWLLAPLTIAVGFSLPPFLVAKVWGR